MKKLSIILLLMFGIFSISIAQVTSPPAKTTIVKQDKVAMAAQKKAAKEAKASAKMQAKDAKVVTASPAAVRLSKDGTPDKRFTANKQAAAPVASAVHLNKSGTPDKRFSANRQTKVTPMVTPRVQPTQTMQAKTVLVPAKTTRTTVAHTSTVKTADKAIGTDAKGRTIYLGPQGGKYYIDKNGNKEYVK